MPNVLIMDRFGSSESGAQGAVEDGANGPRFEMSDDTSVLDDELRPSAPGDGRIGRLARTGRIPVGYYKDPAKTDATFPVDPDGVRWSIPGDLASVEPDGTITVHGRGSASINSGGEKIFPEEVEAAVKSHPEVFDAIVVGLPDERFGERVAVVVTPRGRGDPPTLEDIQEHCRDLIAGYKIPRQMVVVEEIPLTAAGKARHQGGQGPILKRRERRPVGSRRYGGRDSPCARRQAVDPRISLRPRTSLTARISSRRASRALPASRVDQSSGHHRAHRGHHPVDRGREGVGVDVHHGVDAGVGPQAEDPGGHGPGG